MRGTLGRPVFLLWLPLKQIRSLPLLALGWREAGEGRGVGGRGGNRPVLDPCSATGESPSTSQTFLILIWKTVIPTSALWG